MVTALTGFCKNMFDGLFSVFGSQLTSPFNERTPDLSINNLMERLKQIETRISVEEAQEGKYMTEIANNGVNEDSD
jgi:hypothetical protein